MGSQTLGGLLAVALGLVTDRLGRWAVEDLDRVWCDVREAVPGLAKRLGDLVGLFGWA